MTPSNSSGSYWGGSIRSGTSAASGGGGSPCSQYACRNRSGAVPRRAQATQMAPEQERPSRRFQPVDDLGEAAAEVGLLDRRRVLRLPRWIDLDNCVELRRQRMPHNLRLIAQQNRRYAGLAEQCGQRRPRFERRRT